MQLSIVEKRVWWYWISGVILALGVVMLVMFRLPFGIDFTGGSLLQVTWDGTRPTEESVRAIFDSKKIAHATVQLVEEREHIFRFPLISEDEHQSLVEQLRTLGEMTEDRFETIGPSIGNELARKSLMSIVLVLVSIMFYVAWAFRTVSKPVASWKYGIVTIIVLVHDVLIPLGVFALLGRIMGIEFTSSIVVALLAIMGYSVNDTIVVFDRTRENLAREGRTKSFATIVSESVNQTLARSINTALTTVLILVPVFLFGGETIKYFTMTLIVGIIAGAYSSIFIASPLLVTWHERSNRVSQ